MSPVAVDVDVDVVAVVVEPDFFLSQHMYINTKVYVCVVWFFFACVLCCVLLLNYLGVCCVFCAVCCFWHVCCVVVYICFSCVAYVTDLLVRV
jgi:hypothetical protein